MIDTSSVIDGRIVDVGRTGFILGTLIVPRFVLDELQRIADSPDAIRRNRGRRGLEMLSALQKDSISPVEVSEETYPEITEVDAKLVAFARDRGAAILTNDFNLNRVAELQGIRVLNINELANAVKAVVHPGEEMSVKIIQEGKEPGQGVGYQDDGTMIVVEGGNRFMNREVGVTVTRVLQTVAGRMIFAQPREEPTRRSATPSVEAQVGAILVAGGRGRRMGGDKLWIEFSGRPAWRWGLDALLAVRDMSYVIVVAPPDATERFVAAIPEGVAGPMQGGRRRGGASRLRARRDRGADRGRLPRGGDRADPRCGAAGRVDRADGARRRSGDSDDWERSRSWTCTTRSRRSTHPVAW